MPLSEEQKQKLKSMSADERAELLDALDVKSGGGDADLLKTVEALQSKVDKLEKLFTRKPGEDRRKKAAGGSWFSEIFGGV